jgi:hypothetical protein
MLYFSALWQFFRIVAYNAEHFSALLPTMQKNVPLCCLLRRSFFHIVGNNAEKCSNFSSCVFFRVVAHNALFFCAVDHSMEILSALLPNVEKLSALLATMQKNVRIKLSPRIRNHVRIYIRVSIRGLG